MAHLKLLEEARLSDVQRCVYKICINQMTADQLQQTECAGCLVFGNRNC